MRYLNFSMIPSMFVCLCRHDSHAVVKRNANIILFVFSKLPTNVRYFPVRSVLMKNRLK